MTVTADPELAEPADVADESTAAGTRPPRGSRRRRRRLVIGVALAATLAGAYAVQYREARAELQDERTRLAEARTALAGVQAQRRLTEGRTDRTRASIDQVRSDIGRAVDTRTWLDAVTRNTEDEVAEVKSARLQTDTARLAVAADADEVDACLDGVSRAVDANRAGDGQAAVAALQGAAGECTRTLAHASGAVFPFAFADPFVLRAGDTYYGYSTNAGAGDIQVIRSTDLVEWELVGDGLAALPRWAAANATWAPAVLPRDGGYVVYYTVRDAASGRQCISRGTAASPAGPFVDDSHRPLVCQLADEGSIDPSPFVDADGQAFLLWKSEGRGPRPATIWSQPLRADGLALEGRPRPLLEADQPFERGVVEAPSLLKDGDAYYLLYAAADWRTRDYAIAYASCAGPAGPCVKPSDGRVLRSGPRLAGPGGAEVFRDAAGWPWVAFHAYAEPAVGYPNSRLLHVAPLQVVEGRIVLDAST